MLLKLRPPQCLVSLFSSLLSNMDNVIPWGKAAFVVSRSKVLDPKTVYTQCSRRGVCGFLLLNRPLQVKRHSKMKFGSMGWNVYPFTANGKCFRHWWMATRNLFTAGWEGGLGTVGSVQRVRFLWVSTAILGKGNKAPLTGNNIWLTNWVFKGNAQDGVAKRPLNILIPQVNVIITTAASFSAFTCGPGLVLRELHTLMIVIQKGIWVPALQHRRSSASWYHNFAQQNCTFLSELMLCL